MEIKELIENYLKWAKDEVVQKRLENGEDGYSWLYKTLEFEDELTLKKFQDFFDRKDQNEEYKNNYEYKAGGAQSKKPYTWIQSEINSIYSFHKCFAMRNHTRLQCYRNDLSQKGARVRSAVNINLGKFRHKKQHTESQ